MFDLNRRCNQPIVAPIYIKLPFQFLIPMGDLSKDCDRLGHKSSSGYGS